MLRKDIATKAEVTCLNHDLCNFGGMGATGNGKRGLSFDTVLKGLRAQALHEVP